MKEVKGAVNNKTLLLFVLLAGLGLVVGGGIGYAVGLRAKEQAFEKGLAQGQRETEAYYKERIEEVFPPPPNEEKLFVAGELTAISGQTLTVKERVTTNPIEKPEFKSWQVTLSGETQIVKEEENEGAGPPVKTVEAELSDLRVGQRVTVWAEEDIKGRESFNATKVLLEKAQ